MNVSILIETTAWTLVHFLWQGGVAAFVLWLLLQVIRSSKARYLASVLTLTVLFVAATVTFVLLLPNAETPTTLEVVKASTLSDLSGTVDPATTVDSEVLVPVRPVPEVAPDPAPNGPTISQPFSHWPSGAVILWLGGVTIFGLRYLFDWRSMVALRKRAQPLAAENEWHRRFVRLRSRIGVSRPVRLLTSDANQIPCALGVLRPVIIVPVAMLAKLPPAQVEAILLHELAHIRRHDFLVNLLQSVVEILFFFHPAVWWISGKVRTERENCCDDLAASHCENIGDYAGALAALEESVGEAGSVPALCVAADDGKPGRLLGRIRRLVRGEEFASHSAPGWPSVVLGLFAVVACVTALAMLAQAADRGAGKVDWSSLQVSSFGDSDRHFLCIHMRETIEAVIEVQLTEAGAHSINTGVLQPSVGTPEPIAVADCLWVGGGRLSIRFDPQQPGQLSLNDQTLFLGNGRVVVWRQAEQRAHQSHILASELPETKTLANLRDRIIEDFAPVNEDEIMTLFEPGQWELKDGKSLEILKNQADETAVVLGWPASDKWPVLRHEIDLGAGNGWAVAMEKDSQVLWVSHPESFQRINFSDPEAIVTDYLDSGMGDVPDAIRQALNKRILLDELAGQRGTPHVGGNTGGQKITAATLQEEYVIRGHVLRPKQGTIGQFEEQTVMPGVKIEAFTASGKDRAIAETRSGDDGTWELRVRVGLDSLKNDRHLFVRANLPAYRDRDFNAEGEFLLAIDDYEPVDTPAEEYVRVLRPGQPANDTTFRLQQAGEVAGVLRDAEGKPIADALVSVKIDDEEIPWSDGTIHRPGHPVSGGKTDEQGRFLLRRVPRERELHLVASKRGESVQTEAYGFNLDFMEIDVIWDRENGELQCGLSERASSSVNPPTQVLIVEDGMEQSGPENSVDFARKVLEWVKDADDGEESTIETWNKIVVSNRHIRIQFGRPFTRAELSPASNVHLAEAAIQFGEEGVVAVVTKTRSGRIDLLKELDQVELYQIAREPALNLSDQIWVQALARDEVAPSVDSRDQKGAGEYGVAEMATSNSQAIVITITEVGNVEIGGQEIEDESLMSQLKALAETNSDQSVVVRATKDTPFREVVSVLDLIKAAGIWNVSFSLVGAGEVNHINATDQQETVLREQKQLSDFGGSLVHESASRSRPTHLAAATLEKLARTFDPEADRLAQSALAKIQNIQNLPAFRLNYSQTRTKEKYCLTDFPEKSLQKMTEVLQAEHELLDPFNYSQFLSRFSDPDNRRLNNWKIAYHRKVWMIGETPPYTSTASHYWDGAEYWYTYLDHEYQRAARRADPQQIRVIEDFWFLSSLFTGIQFQDRPPESSRARQKRDAYPSQSRYCFDEDTVFCGMPCAVVNATDIGLRLFIDRETERIIGKVALNWQGRLEKPYWTIAGPRLGVKSFSTVEEFLGWSAQLPIEHQVLISRDVGYYMNHKSGVEINLGHLYHYSDFVTLAPGVELPRKIESVGAKPKDAEKTRFDYYYALFQMEDCTTQVDPSEFDSFYPGSGYEVSDYRFDEPIEYEYRKDIPQSEINALLNEARLKRSENERQFASLLQPFEELVGKPAPPLDDTLTWIGERPDLEGQSYLVHFWATWCGSCKRDYPKLKALAGKMPIIGIHPPDTDAETVEAAVDENRLNYSVIVAPKSEDKRIAGYPATIFPYSVLVGADGKVKRHGFLDEVLGVPELNPSEAIGNGEGKPLKDKAGAVLASRKAISD